MPVAVAATTTAGSKRWIFIGIIASLMIGSTQQSAMLGQGMTRIINLVSVEQVQDSPRSNNNTHNDNGTTAVGLSLSIENKTLLNNSNTTGLLSSSPPSQSPATISIPICTYKAYGSKRIHQQPSKVEEVLDFLVARLHNKFNAPVALMYGTALHEYRSGINHINHQTIQDDPQNNTTSQQHDEKYDDPCLHPNVNDKDFDIALFQPHWHYIISKEFTEEIQSKFKWTIAYNAAMKKTTFATMYPNGQFKKAMQIDVYGFQCNTTGGSNDTILFPWDGVRIARDSFLPLRKHKSILLPDGEYKMYNHIKNNNVTTAADGNITNLNHNGNHNNNDDGDGDGRHHVPRYYMPYNPSCLLENIYGSDYMIPKSGKSTQAKYRTKMGIPAHGNPDCSTNNKYGELREEEKVELERQLAFCTVG